MTRWDHHVKLKHLMIENEDRSSVVRSMRHIADEIKKYSCFDLFPVHHFYRIRRADDVISSLDYANKLIDKMYDYADANRIWIE